jgi:hypothetical protein
VGSISRILSVLGGGSFVVAALGLFGGCSLGGLEGLSSGGVPADGGASASPEGGTPVVADADPPSSPDAAADADADSGPINLLTNGDFELGCAGWNAEYQKYFGFTSESGVARSGAGSCRFCMDTNWEAFFEQRVQVPVKAGEKFVGEIWIRAAKPPSELSTAGMEGTSLSVTVGGGGGTGTSSTGGPSVPSDTEWTRITTVRNVQTDASSLTLRLRLQQSGNPASVGNVICVYVDDAVLRRME